MGNRDAQVILVVEDEPMVRMLAVEVLEEAGWSVVEFASADAGAEFCRSHSGEVGALFTDINTPGELNGFDLAALVAKARPNAVLVVTSGRHNAMPDHLVGQVRFLPKPWLASSCSAPWPRRLKVLCGPAW